MSSCLGTFVRIYGITQLLEDPGASLLLERLVREPEVQLLEELVRISNISSCLGL